MISTTCVLLDVASTLKLRRSSSSREECQDELRIHQRVRQRSVYGTYGIELFSWFDGKKKKDKNWRMLIDAWKRRVFLFVRCILCAGTTFTKGKRTEPNTSRDICCYTSFNDAQPQWGGGPWGYELNDQISISYMWWRWTNSIGGHTMVCGA